jgi:hypothetical protein
MASLTTYVKKFGKREGRKQYNKMHREYRKTHLAEIRKYDRVRYKAPTSTSTKHS